MEWIASGARNGSRSDRKQDNSQCRPTRDGGVPAATLQMRAMSTDLCLAACMGGYRWPEGSQPQRVDGCQ